MKLEDPAQLSHDIWLYPSVLSPDLCARLIAQFNADKRRVAKAPGTGEYPAETLSISAIAEQKTPEPPDWKAEDNEVKLAVGAVLADHYTRVLGNLRIGHIHDNGYTITAYRGGMNHAVDHYDGADPLRLTTLVVYLNELSRGGETVFPRQGVTVRPQTGAVLVFPPHYTHVHRVNASPDDRYVLLTWIRRTIPETPAPQAAVAR